MRNVDTRRMYQSCNHLHCTF